MVDAFRTGFVTATNKQAASQWASRKSVAAAGGKGLTGADLDKAVAFASMRTRGARYANGKPAANVKLVN